MIPNLPPDPSLYPQFYLLLTLHCLIGIGAAIVAQRKGFNTQFWLVIGLIGGTAALAVALLATSKVVKRGDG